VLKLSDPVEMPVTSVEEQTGTETPALERAGTIAALGAFVVTSVATTAALMKPELGVGFEYTGGASFLVGVGFGISSMKRGFQRFRNNRYNEE
jgi:hypothetical protein